MEEAGIRVEEAGRDVGPNLGDVFLRLHLARFPESRFANSETSEFARVLWPELWRQKYVIALVAKPQVPTSFETAPLET